FTAAVSTQQLPGGDSQGKFVLDVEILGQKHTVAQVINGSKGWKSIDGQLSDLTDAEVQEMRRSAHVDRVTNLVDLLKDKGFTLTALGESKVNDQPVLGVKVSYQGQPDVTLYFDKNTSLLFKYDYREQDQTLKKEVLRETVLSDYRELDLGAADE